MKKYKYIELTTVDNANVVADSYNVVNIQMG
jgi:hypothetical protein